jgi:hypothetical protein
MAGTTRKKRLVLGAVVLLLGVLVLGFLATTAGVQGMGSPGGSHGGFQGGGGVHGQVGEFPGSFGHLGVPRLGHCDHTQHEQVFGLHHHCGPFVPPGPEG